MLNQVVLVGRITHHIENNTLTLAVNRSFKNENGIYETDFIPVRIYGTMADTTSEYTHTGDIVGIKGRVQRNSDTTEIIAEKVTFLSSSASSSPTKDNPNPNPQNDINKGEI